MLDGGSARHPARRRVQHAGVPPGYGCVRPLPNPIYGIIESSAARWGRRRRQESATEVGHMPALGSDALVRTP